MKRLFFLTAQRRAQHLGLALALAFGAGCPLVILERCEGDADCGSGRLCFAGDCVPVDATRVGAGCSAALDCGPGLTCGLGFPGGYCLAECFNARPCPGDTVCVQDLGRCLRPCGPECARPGYGCVPVPHPGSPTQACAPLVSGADGGFDAGDDLDAGCTASVGLDQQCQDACQCLTADAGCIGAVCTLGCATDFDCPADRRCTQSRCVLGKRLGAQCTSAGECPSLAQCDLTYRRCDQWCANDLACANGYRCSPDGFCIEACAAVPASVGLTCETSPDCARCGFCIAPGDGGVKRCRQRCQLDRDCPDGGLGECESFGSFKVCAP